MQSFRVIKPTAALVPYVRHYWVLSDDALAPVSERTLPVAVSYTHLTLPTNSRV